MDVAQPDAIELTKQLIAVTTLWLEALMRVFWPYIVAIVGFEAALGVIEKKAGLPTALRNISIFKKKLPKLPGAKEKNDTQTT